MIRPFVSFVCISFCCLPLIGSAQRDTSLYQHYNYRAGDKENLPDWVFQPEDQTILGVSDPYLKKDIAKEQAIQRALFLYALTEGVQLSMVADFFSTMRTEINSEKSALKIIKLLKLNTLPNLYNYEIIEEYISVCGEYFVKIDVRRNLEGQPFTTKMEMMISVNEELRFKNDTKILIHIQTPEMNRVKESFFSSAGNRDRKQLNSSINGKNTPIPNVGYWYANCGKTIKEEEGVSLQSSFWNACMESLLQSLSMYNYNEVFIQSSGDKIYGTDFGFHITELNREIVRQKIRIKMQDSRISQNKLIINWEINEF